MVVAVQQQFTMFTIFLMTMLQFGCIVIGGAVAQGVKDDPLLSIVSTLRDNIRYLHTFINSKKI